VWQRKGTTKQVVWKRIKVISNDNEIRLSGGSSHSNTMRCDISGAGMRVISSLKGTITPDLRYQVGIRGRLRFKWGPKKKPCRINTYDTAAGQGSEIQRYRYYALRAGCQLRGSHSMMNRNRRYCYFIPRQQPKPGSHVPSLFLIHKWMIHTTWKRNNTDAF
jgi:hypothetical protein